MDLLTQEGDDWFFPGGRYRSEVWKHFMRNRKQKEVMCSLCNTRFSTSSATTNLSRHLDNEHQIIA